MHAAKTTFFNIYNEMKRQLERDQHVAAMGIWEWVISSLVLNTSSKNSGRGCRRRKMRRGTRAEAFFAQRVAACQGQVPVRALDPDCLR